MPGAQILLRHTHQNLDVLRQITMVPSFGVEVLEVKTLVALDITNKFFDLTLAPLDLDVIILDVAGAPDQVYGIDYTIVGPKRVSWNGFGLDGLLSSGDIVQVLFTRSN